MAKQLKPATAAHSTSSTRKKTPPETSATLVFPRWAVALFFAATTLIFFRSHLFGAAFFWEDFVEYVYPAQTFAAQALRAGTLPFWNPYTFSGMPFLADVAVGFFYPPNCLHALFVSNGELSARAVQTLIIAHFWLAQFTMFLFVRSFRVSDLGSVIASVSYGFGGLLVCHTFHPTMVAHFAWFPLVWMFFAQSLRELRLKPALYAGLLYGVMLLSGHPQSSLYLTLLLAFYTVWMGTGRIAKKDLQGLSKLRFGFTFGGLAVLPIVIGAGLFAVQLLHSQEFASVSVRQNFTFEKAAAGSMLWKQLYTAIVPKFFGFVDAASLRSDAPTLPYYLGQYYDYWETSFYVGVVAVVLAMLGFVHSLSKADRSAQSIQPTQVMQAAQETHERKALSGFLLFAFVFGALYAVGANGFLFGAMFNLPLFNTFRIPARMMVYAALALPIMAGVGFDALCKHERVSSQTLFITTGSVAALAALAALGVAQGMADTPKELFSATQTQGTISFAFIVLAGGVAWLLARRTLSPLVAGAALLVLALVDVNVAGSSFNVSRANPADVYRLQPALQQQLQAQSPQNLFRVRTRERGITAMPRNQGMVAPVMMYEGYTPITLERSLPLASSSDATYDMLGIRYEIAVNPQDGSAGFRERSTAYPRAWMRYRAVVATPETAESVARSGSVDVANAVLLERLSPVPLSGASTATVQHSVQCTTFSANESRYEVSTSKAGIFILSEHWYPAWRISIDGQPTELLRANYALCGVAVPQGKHIIELRYESNAFRTGAWISLTTLAVSLLVLAVVIVRKRKHS